eukprot:TRINITY_DN4653_c0_g5_i2.p2 TRINITY_DN4653_c0_g5~~TRINITY_DN4653_c0_g5_i2.p2  ORF type:complete len:190 (-),score=53.68 TRINITY_DN4653_c0_g5_i2:55-624(-)
MVLGSNYKEKLLEYIDADQLPTEYGGTCNTCATAPDCIPVLDPAEIQRALEMDESAMDLKEQVVARGSKFEASIRGPAGAVYGWYFKTVAHDIGFGVKFIPDVAEGEEAVADVVIAPKRLPAHEYAIQGTYQSAQAGTLHFEWDNTFSYFKSKTIKYMIRFSENEAQVEVRDHAEPNAQEEKKDDAEQV